MLARVFVFAAVVAMAASLEAAPTNGTTFNCNSYLARYPDLMTAFGTNCVRAYDHFLVNGMGEGRIAHYTGKAFDCHGYLLRYPDLEAAFVKNNLPKCDSAFNHYVNNGVTEGRDASADEEEFQCESYLLRYPDLTAAFGHDCEAGFAHYLQYGVSENRDGSGDSGIWHCESYLKRYPDLMDAFGDNCELAFDHYVNHGSSEARDNSFDAGDVTSFHCHSYLDAHADLAATFIKANGGSDGAGSDCVAAFAHFIQFGRTETRTSHYTGNWDCNAYLGRYPDLQAAFGTDCDHAFNHYRTNGNAEGRNAAAHSVPATLSFEIEVTDLTAAQVQNNLPKYVTALAITLNIEEERITLTYTNSRRLVEGTSGVTLIATVTASETDTASAADLQTAVTASTFTGAMATQLQAEGVTATLAVDPATLSVDNAACSVSCSLTLNIIKVTHNTGSAHTHHRCFKNDNFASGCECECAMSAFN